MIRVCQNHLVRLEECVLSSLDLPDRGESLHRVFLVDARAARHRDALNLEYVIVIVKIIVIVIL